MNFSNDGKIPEGIIFSDLGNLCKPACNISDRRVIDKWESVPYETAVISGTMLSAFQTASPAPVTLSPELKGWYRIYVSLMDNPEDNRVFLRLTGDGAQSKLRPGGYNYHKVWWKWEDFEECFWKCADMTGQSVEIARRTGEGLLGCQIAWFRFVPMSDEEVEEYKQDAKRSDTKRIFATHDMFSLSVTEAPETFEEWKLLFESMKHTDVEILSLDERIIPDGYRSSADEPDHAFYSDLRKALYFHSLKKTKQLFTDLIKTGRENGIKMYLSKRMGASLGGAFPYDDEDVNTKFMTDNTHLRCKDRDGTWIDSLSLAYPAVQEYVISSFENMAELGCDGVTLIYIRGIPFVLFEEPVIERFNKKYPGVNCCELPLSDERVRSIHCELMNEFMCRLKNALDEKCKSIGRAPLKIHAYVGSSLDDNRLYGIDVETWAKEGIIDSFSAYPIRITERLDGVFRDDNPELIDLEKYTRKTREKYAKTIHRDVEYEPGHIELEFVEEYVNMAKKYGIKAYFELLPRLKTVESYEEDALLMLERGAENFSLWDCDFRSEIKSQWNAASRLGHLDDIKNGKLDKYPTTMYRILSINGKNISLYNPTWIG